MGVLCVCIYYCFKSVLENQGEQVVMCYQMYCLYLFGLEDGCCLNVYSKVFSMDDWLFLVGLVNMSNCFMVFDIECNLIIELQGDVVKQDEICVVIVFMCNCLLVEYLGVVFVDV